MHCYQGSCMHTLHAYQLCIRSCYLVTVFSQHLMRAMFSICVQICRNWRSSSHGMMLTNISLLLALFGLFLSYIVAAVSPSVPALCAIASASVHYFLLATFCWKLVEAVVMYRKTTASPKDMKYGQVISSLVCWCKSIGEFKELELHSRKAIVLIVQISLQCD